MTIASSNRLSNKKIRENFDQALKAAIDIGEGPFTDKGFNFLVFKALWDLADSWPAINPDLIRKAKSELERQLSGQALRGQGQPPVGPEIGRWSYLA